MKRTETQNGFNSKRPRLDGDACSSSAKGHYVDGSARPTLEWDDDDDELDGALDEVCNIVELSQQVQAKPIHYAGNGNTTTAQSLTPRKFNNSIDFATENKKILDALKTKEGEVSILRSQLQQNQIAKQNDANNHRKSLQEADQKHKASLASVLRQIDQLKGELEFKDLEVKGLTERCKQLEVKSSQINFKRPVNEDKRSNLFSLSQAIISKSKLTAEKDVTEMEWTSVETATTAPKLDDTEAINEGAILTRLLSPSFFKEREEPSVFPMFPTSCFQRDAFDFSRDDKYKWIGLPPHKSHLRRLDSYLMALMQTISFPKSQLQEVHCVIMDIMTNLQKTLDFLSNLPKNMEYDRALLESSDPGKIWDINLLLSDELVSPNEKGVEARRGLALACVLCKASTLAVNCLSTSEFLRSLVAVNAAIGTSQRPMEYVSVSVASLFFIQVILAKSCELDESLLDLIRSLIGEIILSRPKLDALREVVNTLSCGARFPTLAAAMCKKSSAKSCSMFMDARLQQAIFFTRDVCPLKMLQIQVTNLAHLCRSKEHFMALLQAWTGWFHSMSASSRKPHTWLFPEKIHCCDVLECFCYLLYLCIPRMREDEDYKRIFQIGIIALKDCCKSQKRKFKSSTVKLLSTTMKSSGLVDMLSPKSRAAAQFVLTEIEAVVQDNTLAFNISNNLTTTMNNSRS